MVVTFNNPEKPKNISELNNVEGISAHFFEKTEFDTKLSVQEFLVESPRMCMHCRNTGKQVNIDLIVITGSNKKWDAVGAYGCKFCKETTISFFIRETYSVELEKGKKDTVPVLIAQEYIPKNISTDDVPLIIQKKYANFYDIYTQARAAEENNLNQLAGMGYRKSIEFLVTDFLLNYPSDDSVTEEWLTASNTFLKDKINKLPTERLRNTAKAISYIGNDETHYSKRNPNYNIEHMKYFINLMIIEIEREIAYESVEDFLG